MKQDNIAQVAQFWNTIATDFDDIYSGRKTPIARALDRWLRKDMFQRFDWVMKAGDDLRPATICDVGCGSGRFVTALAKKGAVQVTGVDIAPNMISLAQKLAAQEGVSERCRFFQSDVLDWKTDEQFDMVIAIGFWDYIADPLPRLRLIRQMTRGRFLSAWPRLWTWRMPLRKVRLALRGCPVYFFSKPRVYSLLEKTGFEVVSCKTIGKLICIEAEPKTGANTAHV